MLKTVYKSPVLRMPNSLEVAYRGGLPLTSLTEKLGLKPRPFRATFY